MRNVVVKKVHMQIVVLGPHRSGTSAVTRLINMMGAYFDSGQASIGFNDENPKGFWERSDVIALNDRLLAAHGSSWDVLAGWDKTEPAPETLEAIRHDIKRLVLDLDAHRPWVMKDPRLCMTFGEWRPLLEVPVVVSVYRDPLEVAISMAKRNGFSVTHGLAIWEYYTVQMLNSCRDLPLIFSRHAELLKNPVETAGALYRQLIEHGVQGLRLPAEKEITAFVEPALYRSKANAFTTSTTLTSYQQELCAIARGEQAMPEKSLEISALAQEIMQVMETGRGQKTRFDETLAKLEDTQTKLAESSESVRQQAQRWDEAEHHREAREDEHRRQIETTIAEAKLEREAAAAAQQESIEKYRQTERALDICSQKLDVVSADLEASQREAIDQEQAHAVTRRKLGEAECELMHMRSSQSWRLGNRLVRMLTFWRRRRA